MVLKPFRARNTRANYDAAGKHLDMIFFATDTKEILVNGEAYGASAEMVEQLNSAYNNVAYTAPGNFVFTTVGGTTKEFNLTLPTAADSSLDINASTLAMKVKIQEENNALKLGENGLYVDQAALTAYEGKEAIVIEDSTTTTGTKVVSLKINENEKIASQNDNGLLLTLGLNWNPTSKRVQLTGNEGAVVAEMDASDFVLDGMVDDVDLVVASAEAPVGDYTEGTIMVFTFNTDAGSKVLYLDVTSLIDVYVAGEGISITGKTISVVVDPADEGFLKSTATGIKTEGLKQYIKDADDTLKATIDAYTVNGKKISENPVLGAEDIKMTGFVQGTDTSEIAATDTVNGAISKIMAQVNEAMGWYEA